LWYALGHLALAFRIIGVGPCAMWETHVDMTDEAYEYLMGETIKVP
jgi:hypothetical protein